jgi:hypothetical protein
MSSIVVSGDTSGAVTLTVPAVSGTNTLTLPAVTGNILTDKTSGSVLQVVQANYSTSTSNSTNSYVDTGLTATITPKFTTSKILVIVHQNGARKSPANSLNAMSIILLRNGVSLLGFGNFVGYTGSALDLISGSVSVCYQDSPATTSAVTYKTQFASGFSTASVTVQDNGTTSTITLMEIAG